MSSLRKYAPRIAGVLLVVAVVAIVVVSIQNFLDDKPVHSKKKIQQITLLKPPPPPPPPKVTPQPEVKDEVKVDKPKEPEPLPDVPDEPPPAESLGVDAEGNGAGDSFGLIGRKGGKGLLNGAGSPAMYYASQLQRRIEDVFANHEEMRHKAYSVVAGIWISKDGHIERVELKGSTGNGEMDAALKQIIRQIQALAVSPPPDMPQPVRLRISSTL